MKPLLSLTLLVPLLLTSTSCGHNVKTLSGRHRQPINVGTTVQPATPAALPAEPAAGFDQTNPMPATADEATAAVTAEPVACVSVASDTGQPASRLAEIEYRVFFGYGQASLHVPDNVRADLLAAARNAERIRVKGRTDGSFFAPGDERIALMRALAMRDYLVKQGVDATRVELQYASAADYLADNGTAEGRAKNRRVEVVIEPAQG